MHGNNDIQRYLDAFKRRKAQFIYPGVLALILVVVIVFALPPIYKSSATILIEARQLPGDFLRTSVTGYLEERLQAINQVVLSRNNLLDIAKRFGLYTENDLNENAEKILERVRANIVVEPITADAYSEKFARPVTVTVAFNVSFEGREPQKLPEVVNYIASLYLDQNSKDREAQAQSTIQFLDRQAESLRSQIIDLEKQIAEYKEQHVGELPELMQLNLQTMERLQREIDAKQEQIKNLANRRIYLEGQLALLEPVMQKVTTDGKRILTPREELEVLRSQYLSQSAALSEEHPDMVSLKKKISALEGEVSTQTDIRQRQKDLFDKENQLALLSKKYSDQHPDLIALRKQVARLKKEVQSLSTSRGILKVDDTTAENPAYITMKTTIASTNMESNAAQKELSLLQVKYAEYQKRVENTPKVEQKYLNLQRDYSNAKEKYQDIMGRLLTAKEAKGLEEGKMAEKFTILNPAAVPTSPYKPNRFVLLSLGIVLAVGAGLGFGSLAEYLDNSLHSSDELAEFTGQPVLAAIPYFETFEDVRRKRRRRVILAFSTVGLLVIGVGFVIVMRTPWK